mgnify:CR=1 FL=1
MSRDIKPFQWVIISFLFATSERAHGLKSRTAVGGANIWPVNVVLHFISREETRILLWLVHCTINKITLVCGTPGLGRAFLSLWKSYRWRKMFWQSFWHNALFWMAIRYTLARASYCSLSNAHVIGFSVRSTPGLTWGILKSLKQTWGISSGGRGVAQDKFLWVSCLWAKNIRYILFKLVNSRTPWSLIAKQCQDFPLES